MTNIVDFPNNPSVGDTHVVGSVDYKWDGEKWGTVSRGFRDHNDTNNRDAVGAHDEIYIREVTMSKVLSELAPVGTRYRIADMGGGYYIVVNGSDSGGFYSITLSNGNKLRYSPLNGKAKLSETGGKSTVDSASLIKDLCDAGFTDIEVDAEILVSSGGYVISQDNINIHGDGLILVDWDSIGYGVSGDEGFVYHFSGNRVEWDGVDSESLTGKLTPFVEQEYTSFLRFTGNCSSVTNTRGDFHPNYVFAVMSETSQFDFTDNRGEGQLVDGSAQTGVHCLLYQRSGYKGSHSRNTGSNWCNLILHGLSPDTVTVSFNKAFDCGNHIFYGSSTDNCFAEGNEAYGENTDFKMRGDYNTAVNNKVDGGSFSMTNRVVDMGNGFGLNQATSIGNTVRCSRDFAVAYAIRSRTGFNCAADNIVSKNNTVVSENSSANAHLILFDTINNVTCGDSVTCNTGVTDGVRITPTDGVSKDNIGKIMLDSIRSEGCSDQAYQITGSNIIISGLVGQSQGGAGSNSGCMNIRCNYGSMSSFDVRVSNDVSCINIPVNAEFNIDIGYLERPSAGTIDHIIGTGTISQGTLISKVN